MSNLSIQFDFSYYVTTPPDSKIIELSVNHLKSKKIITTVVADGLDPGRQYRIEYDLINKFDPEIFVPSSETFYASKTTQKFSTIANLDSSEMYIIKATISKIGSNSSASDMVTVKCGNIDGCPTTPVVISSKEYIRFDNRPVYQPSYKCNAQINIGATIFNAIKSREYNYEFLSGETNPLNIIDFYPSSGVIIAGDSTQNINTIAKFTGKSGYFCIKVLVTDAFTLNNFEDHLLIQCSTCT